MPMIKNERLYLVMQTICSTGIRVSELKYITVDAVHKGQTQVKLKGKIMSKRILRINSEIEKTINEIWNVLDNSICNNVNINNVS